jgi:hypothetical protein
VFPLKNLLVCFYLCKTLINLFNILLWILSPTCRAQHVDLTLFLVSLIGFQSIVCLFQFKVIFLPWTVPICFLNIGYATLECLRRSLVIGILNLLLCFGKVWWSVWIVKWLCLVVITPRQMVWQKDSTDQLSKF